MNKTIYCRFPLDTYAEEKQFFCVYKTNLESVKNALKDFNDLEFVEPDKTYHAKRSWGADFSATANYIKDGDLWIHSITKSGSDSFYYQILTVLKNSGFEFSSVVQIWYNDYELKQQKELQHRQEKVGEEKQCERPKFKYVRWCDKYDCPAINGCGDCRRQIYGCHTTMVKVKVS